MCRVSFAPPVGFNDVVCMMAALAGALSDFHFSMSSVDNE